MGGREKTTQVVSILTSWHQLLSQKTGPGTDGIVEELPFGVDYAGQTDSKLGSRCGWMMIPTEKCKVSSHSNKKQGFE